MAPEMSYALGWLAGSLIGYFLARILWRRSVEDAIGVDDTVVLTLSSLTLSWSLVAGSIAALAIIYLFHGVNTEEACIFGNKAPEPSEEGERKRSKGI